MSSTWEEDWLLEDELKKELRLIQTEWPNLLELIWNWQQTKEEEEMERIKRNEEMKR
jgi:hypothetical protein